MKGLKERTLSKVNSRCEALWQERRAQNVRLLKEEVDWYTENMEKYSARSGHGR